jgi:serine/threonine-protein kinase
MSDAPTSGSLIAGKYRVLGELGSGGMGSLLEAEHPVLKRTVAIKLVRGRGGAQAFRRLIQEAEAAQALHSEHVVRVFDVGYHDDAPYIVMEKLEGADLATLLEDGPLPLQEAVDCVLEACVGLAEAHALGIVHRDIKPANLFSTRGGQKRLVKVLDFGISKQIHLDSDEADPASTAPNQMLGSPYFMSPEQLRNPRKVDARTDVWSLGVTLYNLLTARHPFEGPAVSEVTAAVFTDQPRDIREHRGDLPDGIVTAIANCLEKRADDRTPSVRALTEAIVPFAGKRGRLAADRVATLSEASPPDPTPRERAPRSLEVTATDAGLSATLPADRAADAGSAREASGASHAGRRGRALPVLLAAGAALAVVSAWFVNRDVPVETTARPPAASASSEMATVSEVPAPASSPAPPAPEMAAPKPGKLGSAPRVVRASAPAKKLLPHASASTSAAPAPPPPRVDIDGVPIVE